MIKVLIIAPLPKEVGGSYTTGVCKVAYELSQCEIAGVKCFIFATNISNKKALRISKFPYQYNGYRWLIFDIMKDLVLRPIKTIKELIYYKQKSHENPLRFEFYKVNFKKVLEELMPDIIHIHGVGIAPLFFANKYKIPIIDTMHGVFYKGLNNEKISKDRLESEIVMSDYFTGLTEDCVAKMQNLLKIPKDKISLIPNGINANMFYYSDNERLNIRRIFNVSDDTIVFITVASIQERKGQFRFVKFLMNCDFDFQYWIIGEGKDKEKIRDFCNDNHLGERVKFFGNIYSRELFKYYSAADIYAHVSTMEGQSLSEMEAYATGLRTIVSKDIKDTVVTNINNNDIYCILDFDDYDYGQLKKWIITKRQIRMSRSDVSWDIIGNKYGELYKKIFKIYDNEKAIKEII